MSKKFTSAQRSYKTYEQEALAIIEGLLKWEDKLLGRKIMIATDHKALEAMKTAARGSLNGRMIRWDEYLSRFNCEIFHVEGVKNKVTDCLSRYYENDLPDEHHAPQIYVNGDYRLDPDLEDMTQLRAAELDKYQQKLFAQRVILDNIEDRVREAAELEKHAEILQDEGHDTSAVSLAEALEADPPLTSSTEGDITFLPAVKAGYVKDAFFAKIMANPHHFPTFTHEDGLIYTTNVLGTRCLCIPRTEGLKGPRRLTELVIDQGHKVLGHLGPSRTAEYVRRWYWWPRLGKEIDKFGYSCKACKMSKPKNSAPTGLLHSLPIPQRPWDSIGMDFVGPFPDCLGYNYLLVAICRLTNMVSLTPMKVTDTSSDVAWLYVRDVVRLHGIPRSIISDRDTKFTAKFWCELHRLTGSKLMMSTSFHPQTDGASERAIRNVSQILRAIVNPDQRDWVYHIPMVEFAINSSISASTGYAPFELNYGYVPRMTNIIEADTEYPGVREFANRALANIAIAHDAIIEARVKAAYHANKGRMEETAYSVGDLVYLSTKNLNLPKSRVRKLAPKFIGPYTVLESSPESSSYKLELPAELWRRKIHPRFHASLLRPHQPNDDDIFPGREVGRFYDFGMPDEQEWMVESIIGHKWIGPRTLRFRVKWTAGDITWEPPKHMEETAQLDEYYELHAVERWQELSRDNT
jgi:hypothetical protein